MKYDDITAAQSAETCLPIRAGVEGLILPYYNGSSAILLRPDGGLELWQANDKAAELVQAIEPDQVIDTEPGFKEREEMRISWARAAMISAHHILLHVEEHGDICAYNNWRSKYLIIRSALRALVGADALDGRDHMLDEEYRSPTFSQALAVVGREIQRISDLT